jgi:hypothetical protein
LRKKGLGRGLKEPPRVRPIARRKEEEAVGL